MKTDDDKTERPTILIVEDDPDIREQMKWALDADYAVFEAEDRKSALEVQRSIRAPLVTLDLGLPPVPDGITEGLRILDELVELNRSTKIIVITGKTDRAVALSAVEQGAYDFLQKPIQLDDLRVILRRALYLAELEGENQRLQQQAGATADVGGIVGVSGPMQKVFETLRKVSGTDLPVLISGESGTGKELVARAIHQSGPRVTGPFVAINCGAIPDNLLEGELFGHERGAFTGAHMQRKGRIESAQGGVLFLDEIGELPPPLQVKLLRYLQDQRIVRLGGREEITVDARILAATNMDLAAAMQDGRFREDLYYRLAVITIPLPPLRERLDDIPLLAQSMLQRYGNLTRVRIQGFTKRALSALQSHAWPGNVRELENCIKRAVAMAQGPRITPEDLQLASSVSTEGLTLRAAREAVEKELVKKVLARHNGNVTRAAVELGISRPTLHELITRHGIHA